MRLLSILQELVPCSEIVDIFAYGSWTQNPIFLGAKSPATFNMSQRSLLTPFSVTINVSQFDPLPLIPFR